MEPGTAQSDLEQATCEEASRDPSDDYSDLFSIRREATQLTDVERFTLGTADSDLEQSTCEDASNHPSECGIDEPQRGREAKLVTGICVCLWVVVIVLCIILVLVTSKGAGEVGAIRARNQATGFAKRSNFTNAGSWQIGVVGAVIGLNDWNMLSGTLMAIVVYLAVALSTIITTLEVNSNPKLVPDDFVVKGTLSNCTQDIKKPCSQLFTVALFTYGLVLLTSGYTFWLYRSWSPWVDSTYLHFGSPMYQSRTEKFWRSCWLVYPNICFMFAAAFPCLSNPIGYQHVLVIIHNICAPCGIAFAISMETIQLSFGEDAFAKFFSQEPTSIYGPLSITQRTRVVIVLLAWCTAVVFLGLQVYLGLGSVMSFKVKTSHGLALVSYYSEVIGLSLVALLPTLAGLGTILDSAGFANALQTAKDLTEF